MKYNKLKFFIIWQGEGGCRQNHKSIIFGGRGSFAQIFDHMINGRSRYGAWFPTRYAQWKWFSLLEHLKSPSWLRCSFVSMLHIYEDDVWINCCVSPSVKEETFNSFSILFLKVITMFALFTPLHQDKNAIKKTGTLGNQSVRLSLLRVIPTVRLIWVMRTVELAS